MATLPTGMVTLPEAARMACFEAGLSGAISDAQLNEIASRLSQLLTLYVLADAGQPASRPLTAEELNDGRFADGARLLVFGDARPPLVHLAVTATALRATLKLFRPPAQPSSPSRP
jgi:hypothetical protein